MTTHDFEGIPMREALRRHMIGFHNWPVITRSTPSFEELDAVHRDLHDPEVDRERAFAQMRRLLESPPEDVPARKWWRR
jgi:hypothetical protein